MQGGSAWWNVRDASGGQLVYTELRRRILDLELRLGQRSKSRSSRPSSVVSRTCCEALRLLAEDLLDQLPTGGMVRALSATEIEELYSVRAVLEGLMAAEAAAARLDAAGEERLLAGRPERAAGRAAGGRHERRSRLPPRHRRGRRAPWASRLHGQVDGQMARYRAFTNQSQERRSAALSEHQAISSLPSSTVTPAGPASSPSSTSSRPGTPR